jgi:HEAT repeat protein
MALAHIGDSAAVPALMEALQHSNAMVRHDAAFALGEIGDEQAIPALQSILSDSTIAEERDEQGYLTVLCSFSVGDQAKIALQKIRFRIRKRKGWRFWRN